MVPRVPRRWAIRPNSSAPPMPTNWTIRNADSTVDFSKCSSFSPYTDAA